MKLPVKKNELIQELSIEFKRTKSKLVYNKLYNLILPQVQLYIYKIVKDYDDSNDISSEVMIKLWQKIDMYNENWRFSTWIYSIARYDALQFINYKKNTVTLTIFHDTGSKKEFNSFEIFNSEKDFETLYNTVVSEILKLNGRKKEVLIDREINRMKYKDISVKYNINIDTIKTLIRQSRIQVLAKLSEKKHIVELANEILK